MQSVNGLPIGGDNATNKGVDIAVESQSEWKIDYIQYDGTECFIPPSDFADIVAKNVSKMQWQDIIDDPSTLDADDQEKVGQNDDLKNAEKDLLAFDSVREATKDRNIPMAGPWTSVAKCLHESLQEVDVLLDTLRVSRTPYLTVSQVAAPNEDNRSQDLLNKSKSFLWVSRRKAFMEALNILEVATKARQHNNLDERPAYFNELKAMRENWRIRKINDFVFGDLGYRIYGPKFAQGELFDIFWDPSSKPTSSKRLNRKCIQVQVPKNLMKRTKLAVSLVKDSSGEQEEIFASSSNQSVYYTDNSRNLPWETTLKWAQESLINRDVFTQLTKESVDEKHVCIATENSLIVCLANGMLLKFERLFYPFQEMEIPQCGDPYLTGVLHDLFVRDIVRPPHRPQQFVGLPITSLPENLDLRGPQGVSAEEISSRLDKFSPLLSRMIEVANHYILLDQVMEVLNQQMLCKNDPQFTWRWIRCTSTFSMLVGILTNQCHETMGKMTFMIKIGTHEVSVITKDNLVINCHGQMSLLQETLNLMSANCQLLAASLLAKLFSWQILHTNTNAFCKEGTPAPTFLAYNPAATKKIFIQFFTDGRPYQMYIKRTTPKENGTSDSKQEAGAFQDEPMDEESVVDFIPINSARVPGKSLLWKLDHIYTMFS